MFGYKKREKARLKEEFDREVASANETYQKRIDEFYASPEGKDPNSMMYFTMSRDRQVQAAQTKYKQW